MSRLVQLLLPVFDGGGRRRDDAIAAVARELTERFGGATTYARAPAKGAWRSDDGEERRDDVVVCEVMVDALDPAWWRAYREQLESRFEQEEIVVRAWSIERL